MVDIISKRDGPRREDVAAKRVLRENRGTIHKMMDHLTGGQLSSSQKKPAPAPEPDRLIIHTGRATDARDTVSPYVRISVNGRVVVADQETSRQLHFLGEIRGPRRNQRFILATKENGFYALIEEDLEAKIADLDGKEMTQGFSEDDLIKALTERLGITGPGSTEKD